MKYEHGTLTAYTNGGCRCRVCRLNWRDYQRKRRGPPRVERVVSGAAADPEFWEKVRVVQEARLRRW